MKYQIKVTYDTGDSFTHYPNEVDILEGTWEDLDVVTANIERIKEHYILVKDRDRGSYTTQKDYEAKIVKAKNKPWFCKDFWQRCLMLKLDNGNEYQVSAFWTGYFETLRKVEVIPLEKALPSYSPNEY